MIKINGKEAINAQGQTLAEYLKAEGFDTERIAVECDGNIIPKKDYINKIILDGEIIEIVSFVGGG